MCINHFNNIPKCGMEEVKFSYFRKDIVITVVDEVNSKRKKFICQQHILLKTMGYFRYQIYCIEYSFIFIQFLLSREASINDDLGGVDISVHCDVKIFAWLMQYVKADQNVHVAPNVLLYLMSFFLLERGTNFG